MIQSDPTVSALACLGLPCARPSDIKTLSAADFEMWRMELKTFISERQGGATGSARHIYVVQDGSKDLVSVDLAPVFVHCDRLGRTITAVQKQLAALPATGTAQAEVARLQQSVAGLSKEYTELDGLLSAKVPQTDASQHAELPRFESAVGERSSRPQSVTSTVGEDDAVFYDADDIELDHPDETEPSSTEEGGVDDSDDLDDDDSDAPDDGALADGADESHRTKLPHKVAGDDVGILGVLKKNVGKDLSTISFPVTFNLPLSLLQAAAEEYEYAPALLERAATTEDWSTRLCLIGAWAISGYAGSKLRASRKPFNPMLGETYELVRDGGRLKFIAEKVVHNPPIVAVHAEGHGWRSHGWSTVKQKFWGKSWELIPEGSLVIELPERGETYAVKRPGAFMRNLIAGAKYIEYVGELSVTNVKTGENLKVDFKQGTVLGGAASRNHVVGNVYDAKGSKGVTVKGKWTDSFAIQHDKENYQVLWEAAPFPSNSEDYYGFTYFAMSLNELNPKLASYLPRTDSRFRPDQRAFENGNVEQAEELKHAVETAQRRRRTERADQGLEWQPEFFHADPASAGSADGQPDWLYGGANGLDYFQKRAEAIEAGPKKAQVVWDSVVPEVFQTS